MPCCNQSLNENRKPFLVLNSYKDDTFVRESVSDHHPDVY